MTVIREIARFSGQEAEKTYSVRGNAHFSGQETEKTYAVREIIRFSGRQFFLKIFCLATGSVIYETMDYSIGMVTDVGYFFPVQTFWEATFVLVCSDQTPG